MSFRQSVILRLSMSIHIEIQGFRWTELCDILPRILEIFTQIFDHIQIWSKQTFP